MGTSTSEIARPAVARIGPNAIIQVATTMRDRLGPSLTDPLLFDATGYTMARLPSDMIDEHEVQSLVRALVAKVGPGRATRLLREAGHRTADYLLANRIPLVAQWVMRCSPRRLSLTILLAAIRRNAWTFVGSGHFRVESAPTTPELVIESCAMCCGMHETQPICDFYAGTFERLIRVLVAKRASVAEIECCAQGGRVCRFALHGILA